MYAVATHRLSLAADFPPIQQMSRVIVWVAFFAWALAMAACVVLSPPNPVTGSSMPTSTCRTIIRPAEAGSRSIGARWERRTISQ